MLRRFLTVLVLLLPGALAPASAIQAQNCWDLVQEQQELGFDFRVLAEVTGPDSRGVYTYVYRIFRVDQGPVTYRDPSHFSMLFACEAESAVDLILGGVHGIYLSGQASQACSTYVADSLFGFNEPGLGPSCPTNGIKIEFCDYALIPDGDGISYPDDPGDPVLIITFMSLSPPVDGLWFAKGGRRFAVGMGGKTSVQLLTDGGRIPVPGCRPPVPVAPTSWGRVKQMFD